MQKLVVNLRGMRIWMDSFKNACQIIIEKTLHITLNGFNRLFAPGWVKNKMKDLKK
jgi:hypothetical protein